MTLEEFSSKMLGYKKS